jgi:septal ring factor EnvC (AmiA/AmiB activator)
MAGLLDLSEAVFKSMNGSIPKPLHLKALLFGVILLMCHGMAPADDFGIVEARDLNVRAGPGTEHRIISRLEKGARVRVTDQRDGWLEIEHNGNRGFILNESRYVRLSAGKEDGALKKPVPAAETIRDRLEASQSKLEAITDKEADVLNALNGADEALSGVRTEVRAAREDLADIDDRISELETEYSTREKEIGENENYAAQRLAALYKLSWVGRIQLLATADTFFDFIQRKVSLERILRQDEALLEKLHQDQGAVETLLEQLNVRKAEKRALELTLKERMDRMDAEQKRRNTLLAKIQGEKALALAALESLQAAARELDSTVRGLQPQAPLQPPLKRDQASYKPFDEYKGLLSWPVRGKILSFFGPHRDGKYNVTNFQRGITIQAERGEPIRAVADGYAVFAKWFKGFGNMVIIDHGNHYYTVYAHLEEVFKVKGDRVEKGEVIATVGDSGSLTGPALHFEVRHHGEPLDPLEWISRG